jgi:hypothetical protein
VAGAAPAVVVVAGGDVVPVVAGTDDVVVLVPVVDEDGAADGASAEPPVQAEVMRNRAATACRRGVIASEANGLPHTGVLQQHLPLHVYAGPRTSGHRRSSATPVVAQERRKVKA